MTAIHTTATDQTPNLSIKMQTLCHSAVATHNTKLYQWSIESLETIGLTPRPAAFETKTTHSTLRSYLNTKTNLKTYH